MSKGPTTVKDFMISGIVQACAVSDQFSFEIHVVVNAELGIPESVKQKFGYGAQIVLSLQSDQHPTPKYDFSTGVLSWSTTFSQTPVTISVPIDNIDAVLDKYNDQAVRFFNLKEPLEQIAREQVQNEQKLSGTESGFPEDTVVITKKGKLTLLKGGKYVYPEPEKESQEPEIKKDE
jgi:stringent starvation protein B